MFAVLFQLVIVLLIVGLLLWAVGQFPIDPTIARLIRVVAIVFIAVYLLYVLMAALGGGPIHYPLR